MDKITSEERSKNMSKIKSKNTKPELLVRKYLTRRGSRYRIHYKLPGKPDVVFPSKKIAFFINGCFWHGHNCKKNHVPKTNSLFWLNKISNNKKRDKSNKQKLIKSGWKVFILWECNLLLELEKVYKQYLLQ